MPIQSVPDPSIARRRPSLACGALLLFLTPVLGAQQPPEAPPSPPPPEERALEQQERLRQEIDEQIERQQEVIEEALDQVERELRRERERPRRRHGTDSKVSIGSSVRVEEDRVAENVVAILGSIKIDGEVIGDAVAIMGSVKIDGRVTGDVVAVMGGVELGPEAEVLGDITSVGGVVDRAPGATIVGTVSEVAFAPDVTIDPGEWWPRWRFDHDDWAPFRFFDYMSFVWTVIGLAMLVLVVSLVLLVAPQAVARVEFQAVSEPWKSGLVGLAVQVFFVPVLVIVSLILAVSIVGIPLLLLLPFVVLALFIAALLGYTGSALAVGRAVDRRFNFRQASPFVLLLLGVAVIQAFSLFGDILDLGGGFLWFFAVMFGLFGFLLRYLAWTVGLGAVFLTRFGTSGEAPPPLLPSAEPEIDAESEEITSSSALAESEEDSGSAEPDPD